MSAGKFGVAVIGLGIAGRVRVRDLLQWGGKYHKTKDVHLVGYISRRELEIEGAQQITWEDALTRDDVNAVIICTENSTHEKLAREVIKAKKHALVEFPLALSSAAARNLQAEATSSGVLCYEEDISLLTESHVKLKELVKDKTLAEGFISLEASYNPGKWILDLSESGSPFHSSISQIHNVVDLFGDLEPVGAEIIQTSESIESTAQLLTKDKKPVTVKIVRKVDLKRARKFCYKFEDGSLLDEVPGVSSGPPMGTADKPGLFYQDFIEFYDCVKGEDRAHSDWLTVRCLEIADKLQQLAAANPKTSML